MPRKQKVHKQRVAVVVARTSSSLLMTFSFFFFFFLARQRIRIGSRCTRIRSPRRCSKRMQSNNRLLPQRFELLVTLLSSDLLFCCYLLNPSSINNMITIDSMD